VLVLKKPHKRVGHELDYTRDNRLQYNLNG
jgi:hypothetical protein